MSAVREDFTKLKNYYQKNNPGGLKALGDPATDKDISELQKKLPGIMRLPKGYVEFLKMHNGADGIHRNGDGSISSFSVMQWKPCSIKRVLRSLDTLNELLDGGDFDDRKITEPSAGVKSLWWNPKWLPIFANGAGDYLCIDFDPVSGGKIGQIIDFDHTHGKRPKLYDSFDEMFATLVHSHIEEADKFKQLKEEQAKQQPKERTPSWLDWIFG